MNTQAKNKKMRRLGAIAALFGLGLVANTASADILLARQNTNPQNFAVTQLSILMSRQVSNRWFVFLQQPRTHWCGLSLMPKVQLQAHLPIGWILRFL